MQFCPVLLKSVYIHDSEILSCDIKKKNKPTNQDVIGIAQILVLWCCPCTSAWREGDVSKSSVTVVFVARGAQA